MQARAYLLPGAEDGLRSLVWPVAISLLCHLLFFAWVVYSPGRFSGRKMPPTIVNVSLVTLAQFQAAPASGGPDSGKAAIRPPAEKASLPKAASSRKPAPPVKPAVPERKRAETVSLSPKKRSEKTSRKEETPESAQALKRAIEQLKEKAEASRPSTVETAIDRIRGQVAEKESESRVSDSEQAAGRSGSGTGAAGLAGGGQPAPEILVYQQEIAYHIRNNWVYPEQLAGQRKDLEAVLEISIMASGEIRDVRFEKKSGSGYLDDSAYKAVLKSNPLPALPKGYQFYSVKLRFTPAGL